MKRTGFTLIELLLVVLIVLILIALTLPMFLRTHRVSGEIGYNQTRNGAVVQKWTKGFQIGNR